MDQEQRRRGLGGTDMSAIMGVNPWRDRMDVWLEKTGHPMWTPKAETPAMRWGTILEPVLRSEYVRETGLEVVPPPPRSTFDDPEVPTWGDDGIRFAHPDGLIGDDGIWEGKTSSDPDAWADGVPIYYRIQQQQYLELFGRSWSDVSVLLPGGDYRIYREEQDLGLQLQMAEEADVFWNQHVVPRVPPGDLDPVFLFPIADPEATDLLPTEEVDAWVRELLELKAAGKQGDAREEELKTAIKTYMGVYPKLEGAGWSIQYSNPKPPVSVGWEQVATSLWNTLEVLRRHLVYGDDKPALPEEVASHLDRGLYATLVGMYTVTGKTTRPFVVKEKKEKQA